MPQDTWKVVHYNHAGYALGEVFPEALHFGLYLDKAGDIQYDVDITSSLCTETNTKPYYTDYQLVRGTRNIQAGIHTGVEFADVSNGPMAVSGLDWLHYFEGCFWPFDPANPVANLYMQAGRDIALIVDDLLDTILAQSNRLSFAYSLSAIGQTLDYKIDVADTTNLLDRIVTLSQINPGFDFGVSPDLTRTFTIYAPQRGISNSFVFEQGSNIQVASWGNTGPKGTHLLAIATSASGGQLGSLVDHSTISVVRRWDVEENFNNVQSQAQLDQYAAGMSLRDGADQIAFSAKYIPLGNEDFWGEVNIGDICRCRIPIARGNYDTIDDNFRVVGISCDVTDEGEEEITVTFDYPTLPL